MWKWLRQKINPYHLTPHFPHESLFTMKVHGIKFQVCSLDFELNEEDAHRIVGITIDEMNCKQDEGHIMDRIFTEIEGFLAIGIAHHHNEWLIELSCDPNLLGLGPVSNY